MEIRTVTLNQKKYKDKPLVIAPIGDIQWAGAKGSTAIKHLEEHIEMCLSMDAYFIGMGDYIDFASPSNRDRLNSAALYDTAKAVVSDAAKALTLEVYERFLKRTTGRWLGLVHGHHYYEDVVNGHTDFELSRLLQTTYLGTSAYVRVLPHNVTLWLHHGNGNGNLPSVGINKLFHVSAGLAGADIYLMGHNTKMAAARISRPYTVWDKGNERLKHKDVWLVNTGGFSMSNAQGHKIGLMPHGDYAEEAMLTPAPLTAPIITVWPSKSGKQPNIRVGI